MSTDFNAAIAPFQNAIVRHKPGQCRVKFTHRFKGFYTMSNAQLITVLKAIATVLRLTAKAIVYLSIALYVVGELLFSELETVAVEEPKPARTVAKTIAQPTVLVIDIPADDLSDADKETIALATDARRYATLTSSQLRKECSTIGIKWRNAHGPSKHLTKADMIEALAA